MKIKFYYLSSILSLILTSMSCEKDHEVVNIDRSLLVPLNIGNFWNYQISYYDSLKNVLRIDSNKITVTGDTIINNQLWYNIDFGGKRAPVAYRNTVEGLFQHDFWHDSYLIFKYPIGLGEVYNSTKVISTNEIINVPAGNFSCINYQHNYLNFKYSTLISPGIGFIKFDIGTAINGGQLYISEIWKLVDYNIK